MKTLRRESRGVRAIDLIPKPCSDALFLGIDIFHSTDSVGSLVYCFSLASFKKLRMGRKVRIVRTCLVKKM